MARRCACSGPSATRSRSRTSPRGSRVAIVAGGIGAAPFPALLKALASAGAATDFYFGGRNARELALAERFAGAVTGETILSSDDGSLGEKGFVTQALARRLAAGAAYARVYACGPMPMFAALAKVVGPAGISVGVLDRGRDGLRLRRVPRLRHPGDREAVHRVVQRGADLWPGEDQVVTRGSAPHPDPLPPGEGG